MAKGDIKNRREVERLSMALEYGVTSKHYHEAFTAYGNAFIGSKIGWCDVCCHEFDSAALWANKRKKQMKCPCCGSKLSIKRSPNKYHSQEKYYFSTVEVIEDWQVIRTYLCKRDVNKRIMFLDVEMVDPKSLFWIHEVFQWWIKPGFAPIVLSYGVSGMSYYYDQWNFSSKFKIRKSELQHYVGSHVGSGAKLHPIAKRNGLTRLFNDYSVINQIRFVFDNPCAEILLKAGANTLFTELMTRDDMVRRYWPSIRVALRHGYNPRDARTWLDYINLLFLHDKDIHNPHYICPADLNKAHKAEMTVEERIRLQKEAERERKRLDKLAAQLSQDSKLNVEYVKRMGKMLGVVVKVDDIELRPLQSIREFYEEGKELSHCVFVNKYYSQKNSLILSAKVKGQRTETVEINMLNWKIIQCRAKHNGRSKYHDAIVKVVEDNMNAFRRFT